MARHQRFGAAFSALVSLPHSNFILLPSSLRPSPRSRPGSWRHPRKADRYGPTSRIFLRIVFLVGIWIGPCGVAGAADFLFSHLSPFGDAFSDKLNWFEFEVPGSGDNFSIVNLVSVSAVGTMNYDNLPGIRYGDVLFVHDYEVRGGRIAAKSMVASSQGPAGVRLLAGTFTRDTPSRIEARTGGYLKISGLALDTDVALSAVFDAGTPGDPPPRGGDSVIEVLQAVAGRGAITVEGTPHLADTYVSFGKPNSFTGALRVSGTLRISENTGLGTTAGGTTIDERGSLWIEASAARLIAEPMTVNGEVRTFRDAPGAGAEVTLTGNIVTNAGFFPRAQWKLAGPMTLSGALGGVGGHTFSGAAVRMALAGPSANTFAGSVITGIDLFMDKPAGVTAVPGDLRADPGATILWGRDNQVGDGATLTLDGATADLNDKAETITNLHFGLRGGVVRTGFPGGLRLNGNVVSTPSILAVASPKMEGNLLLGGSPVGVTVGVVGPTVGLEVAAAITPAVLGASLEMRGSGLLVVSGVCTAPARITGGTLEVNSTSPSMLITLDQSDSSRAAKLAGSGTVGSITAGAGGGIVAPGGDSPGLLRCRGVTWSGDGISFGQQTFFSVDIKGSTPGTGYDQLNVTGAVALNGAGITLDNTGFIPVAGTSFTLIANDGSDPVVGTFRGFPQGSSIGRFSISYSGGTGNDVVLTAIAPPSGVTRTWTGAGADANWGTAANWSPSGAPQNGDELVFPSGAARRTNTNNRTNLAVQSISIGGGPYLISGNGIALAGGLSVGGTSLLSHRVDLALNLTSAQIFSIGSQFLSLGGEIETNGMPVTFVAGGNIASSIITCGGVISGGAGDQFVKNGAGLLTLTNANTTRGNLRIAAGAVRITNSAALGSRLGATIVERGTSLIVGGTDLALNEPIRLAGSVIIGDDAGTVAISDPIDCEETARLVISATGVPQVTMFDEVRGVALTKAGAGTLVISGAKPKSLSSGFTVAEGRLIVTGTAGVIALPGTTTVGTATTTGVLEIRQRRTTQADSRLVVNPGSTAVFDSPEISFGYLSLMGGTVTTDSNGFSLNGLLDVLPAAVPSTLSGIVTLMPGANLWSVADGPAVTDLQVDAIVRELVLTDASLEKTGSGSAVFTAPNTFSAIVFQQGVNTWNSNSANTKVTVNAGTLLGTGRTAAFAMASGGTLSPGGSLGILTTAGLDLTAGGTLRLELNGSTPGSGHDQIRCTDSVASVDLSAAALLLSQGFPATPGQTLTIIDVQGTGAAIPFAALPEGATALAGVQRYRISYLGGTGNDVTLTALAGAPVRSLSFGPLATTADGATRTLSGGISGGPNAAGLPIQFEGSFDLQDWIPLGRRFADNTGTTTFEFIQAAGQKTFFIRARLP